MNSKLYTMTPENSQNLGDILIVDDVPTNLRLLSQLLTEKGYTVRKAMNGKLAINAAHLMPPDLILLDILMPGIDGYEVCRQLKESDRTRHVPIIFMSAKDETIDKIQAFNIGGADYITKPFKVAEVLARVENHVRISQLQKQLQEHNLQLQQEISDRKAIERDLQALNQNLELRVQERTAELNQRNQQLIFLQTKLEKALEKEQSLSLLKSQLITTISHQFRTPLAVISSSLDILKIKVDMGEENSIFDRSFQRIDNSIEQITQMLEDVLTLARFNSQDIHFQPEIMNLTNFCQNFIKSWKLPKNSQHQLSFSSQGESPPQIYADSSLLQKILNQLLANAVRYSPKGGNILLELIYEPTAVKVRLQDSGIGIPKQDLENVGDRFYRASNANSIPGTPGAGIGLAIAKLAVEMHGGTLIIESELNQGTTVTVSLPLLTEP